MFAILMPSNFTMKEGAPLWPGVRLGKFLGAGAQVGAGRLPPPGFLWVLPLSGIAPARRIALSCLWTCAEQRSAEHPAPPHTQPGRAPTHS